MRLRWVLCCVMMSAAFAAKVSAEAPEFSIADRPRWYTVGESAEPCFARDLTTHQPLGKLEPGTKILAFGATEKWVTFAYRGRVAYTAAGCLQRLYPHVATEVKWRGFGPSLEEKIKATRAQLLALAESGALLAPQLLRPTPGPQQGGGVTGAGAPLAGVQNYVRENLTPQRGRGGGYY